MNITWTPVFNFICNKSYKFSFYFVNEIALKTLYISNSLFFTAIRKQMFIYLIDGI